ncbi:hypothetical protein F5X99DRAFT_11434 [Biscogniauxia marginata]|nr:hypothetical protein F5X99DRAFT_11434 [Biscogniauxia marginata]
MQLQSSLMAAVLAAGSVMAHMNMKDPAPLAYKGNPNAKEPNIDYSITSPIQASQFPCKGYLKLIGTAEGASVKTYAPGEQSTMTVEGGASHNGGSCQLSLSYDQKTFTVIKSFIGNCPTSSGGTFDFTIPDDAPEGDDVVFSWSWVNKTGNREFYQSCAVVTIKGSGKRKRSSSTNTKRAVAWADRPKLFEANLGGEYCTKEGVDTVFPEPGPDVENTASDPGPAILCSTGADAPEGSGSGSDSGSDSGSGSGSGSGSESSSSAPAQSSAASTSMYVTTPFSSSTSAHVASSTISSFINTIVSPVMSDILTVIPITPTTLSTATSPPATSASATTAPVSSPASSASKVPTSSAVAGTPATSAKTPASTGGVTGQQQGSCDTEGAWNCIDGSNFQRCASGQWSAVIPMAAGTKCSAGVSDNLQMRRRRDRVRRRGFSAWDW